MPGKPCDENPLSGMPAPRAEDAAVRTPAAMPGKPCDENPLSGMPAPRPAEAATAGVRRS